MHTESISYHKVFNLGNYSNEKIGVEIKLAPGEDVLDAFAEAKKMVEKSHKFFTDLPMYEMAKRKVADPDDCTGREVKEAQVIITAFEANYPDYLAKFVPASRQLTEGIPPKPYDTSGDETF
jgi:hypothetical protein